jgi:S1-C subfamily serine protease
VTGFDWIVLGLVPVMAYAGYRLGFLVSTLSFGGFVLGVLVGLAAAPELIGGLTPGPGRALLAFALVLGAGVVCQAAGSFLGGTVRDAITGPFALRVDAALGVLAALVALFAGAWLVGSAAGKAGDLPFAASARDSRIVAAVSATSPLDSDSLLTTFATLVDRSGFPAVFSDAGLERIDPVPDVDPAVLAAPGVRAAAGSLVKVLGSAPECRRSLEGSGFVVAPGRVMTNAHVVAGTREVDVYLADSVHPYRATIVVFDPRTDVAVLAVPDLKASPLTLGPELQRGDDAVVAGFPGDGPLQATAARVRGQITAVGEDIYGVGSVQRDVYALRADVRSGNSGGPLLDPQGRVVGLVFAASVDDPSTGYALTPHEVRPALEASRTTDAAVSTGPCTND